jgi:hypothetical protein
MHITKRHRVLQFSSDEVVKRISQTPTPRIPPFRGRLLSVELEWCDLIKLRRRGPYTFAGVGNRKHVVARVALNKVHGRVESDPSTVDFDFRNRVTVARDTWLAGSVLDRQRTVNLQSLRWLSPTRLLAAILA